MLSHMKKHVKTILITVIAFFVLSCFAGYGLFFSSSSSKGDTQRDYAVAVLNGERIMRSEIENTAVRVAEGMGAKDITSEDFKVFRKYALDTIVLDKEMTREVKSRKVKVTDAEIDAAYKNIMDSFPTREEFIAQMDRMGVKESDVKSDIEKDLLRKKLLDNVTSDIDSSTKEAKMFYEKNIDAYTRPAGTLADVAVTKDKATAEAIKAAVEKGEAWDKVMEANKEGLITYTKTDAPEIISDQLVAQMPELNSVRKLAKGEVSPVTELKNMKAFFVAVNNGKTEKKVLTYEEAEKSVKATITEMRKEQYQKMYMENLLTQAKIEIKDEEIFPAKPEEAAPEAEVKSADKAE